MSISLFPLPIAAAARRLMLGLLTALATLPAFAADVILIGNEARRCAIVVSEELLAPDVRLARDEAWLIRETEAERQRLRDSVLDLSRTLEIMSGVPVEVLTAMPEDGRLPILVGATADARFGALSAATMERQTWRLVVTEEAIGCLGASDLAVSYAVYEILDRLGCRWYMPGPMGEVIPRQERVVLAAGDVTSTPRMLYRNIWFVTDAYQRRNRLGGTRVEGAHTLENYLSKEDKEKFPEMAGVKADGTRDPAWIAFNWASPKSAEVIAEKLIDRLNTRYVPSISLSPRDATTFSLSPEELALDTGDMDPTFGSISLTDRLLTLANRIAEQVTAQHPDVIFGLYAYVNYTRPPLKVKPHDNIAIGLAPITYNRVHPMTNTDHPTSSLLRSLVEGWGAAHDRIFFRGYIYNLAEVTAPCPMITKWSEDIPIYMANNVRYWMPESMATFEANLPGLWLNVRMGWDTTADPAQLMQEFHQKFYGAAAAPMAEYWQAVDAAWVETPEWSGSGHGHSVRFPPEVMTMLREKMDRAVDACRTAEEARRVELADRSLRLFEVFMQMKESFAGNGRNWNQLGPLVDRWHALYTTYEMEYASSRAFQRFGRGYFNRFFEKSYREAAALTASHRWLSAAHGTWHWQKEPEGDDVPRAWASTEMDHAGWPTVDTARQTWSTIGLYHYMGTLWYRQTMSMGEVPEGKKVTLWLGKVDGSMEVFIDGQQATPVNLAVELQEKAGGYCIPLHFDITEHVQGKRSITVAIRATRTSLNELGTGGLMGPVRIYCER